MSWRSNIFLNLIMNHPVIFSFSAMIWFLTFYLDFNFIIMIIAYALLLAFLAISISDSSSSILINRVMIFLIVWISVIAIISKISSIVPIYEKKPDRTLESYSIQETPNSEYRINLIDEKSKLVMDSFYIESKELAQSLKGVSNKLHLEVVYRNHWYMEEPDYEYNIVMKGDKDGK